MPKGCLCPYLDKYNGSGTVWKRIFKAHPGECSKEVLAVAVTKDDIDRLEIRYIAEERAVNPEGCVNISVGGERPPVMCGADNPNFGKQFSDETRRKLSETHKGENNPNFGRPRSDETRRKISEANKSQIPWSKGKHLSDEHKRKLSEAHKGQIPWIKGKHLSEEHRRKIGEAGKGRHHSEESKKKMSEAHKGRQLSEETKRKMSEAVKAYWARKKVLTVNN